MNYKKPKPLQPGSKQKSCPVCGQASYSLLGTHPQCAMSQASAVVHAAQKKATGLVKPKLRGVWVR